MSKGRKRLPDHLKVLKNTDQPSRMNPDAPEYEADEIQCPPHFDETHKAVWMDLVPQLIRAGAATNIDSYALEMLVNKWCDYKEAQDKLDDLGQIIRSPNGYPQLSPYYSVAKSAFSDFGKLMTEFGMTPASRTKIKVESGTNKKSSRFDGI